MDQSNFDKAFQEIVARNPWGSTSDSTTSQSKAPWSIWAKIAYCGSAVAAAFVVFNIGQILTSPR